MWISPYTSIFSYTNWSYILSFHCHFSPSSMAKFEYLLTFLSAMIPCISMLEQWCKRKKRIHSRFSETACKMSLTLFPLVQWQFFLNECSTLHFFSVFICMFSFYCSYLPKRTFHCHFHLCYVIFNVFEMFVSLCV